MKLRRPLALMEGDTVMAVSLSWGGPGAIPGRYQAGKQQLEERFGLRVTESPHALAEPDWLAAHPEARAEDLMTAFSDSGVAAVFSTIGGDDSVRILPHIDLDVIRSNPKVVVGFSDTTVTHLACWRAGLGTVYGPSIMAGFGESGGMFDYLVDSFRKTVFEKGAVGVLSENSDGWTEEFTDWSDLDLQHLRRKLQPSEGWRYHGERPATGQLLGGCAEVLEVLKGTEWWPGPEAWEGAVLFLETSEERPSPAFLTFWLRNYAAHGILARLAGILYGRPVGAAEEGVVDAYDEAILKVVREEENLDMPIVTNMDFGHTEPMLSIPYGVACTIDPEGRQVSLDEPAVV